MNITNIPARPIQRDCTSHMIYGVGEFPRTTYIARFEYEDGSVREYDGREWKLLRPCNDLQTIDCEMRP